jgi:hypothetical protein
MVPQLLLSWYGYGHFLMVSHIYWLVLCYPYYLYYYLEHYYPCLYCRLSAAAIVIFDSSQDCEVALFGCPIGSELGLVVILVWTMNRWPILNEQYYLVSLQKKEDQLPDMKVRTTNIFLTNIQDVPSTTGV